MIQFIDNALVFLILNKMGQHSFAKKKSMGAWTCHIKKEAQLLPKNLDAYFNFITLI